MAICCIDLLLAAKMNISCSCYKGWIIDTLFAKIPHYLHEVSAHPGISHTQILINNFTLNLAKIKQSKQGGQASGMS